MRGIVSTNGGHDSSGDRSARLGAGSAMGASNVLMGQRVAVIGAGEVLPRVLGQLHRLGAACVVLDDPYRAIAEMARRPGSYPVAVFVLPSIYPNELPAIAAILRHSPGTRVVLAAAEQQVALLAAALRLGASGVVTEEGIESFGTSEREPAPPPSIVPARPPAVMHAPPARVVEAKPPSPALQEEVEAEEPEPEHEQDMDVQDPILTADELHALLHDDEPRTDVR